MTRTPLLVFADDWGRHPSSCQHLIRQLLPTHAVVWVNTIGTRRPRFDLLTLRRIFGKLTQWLRPAAPGVDLPANLMVRNPRMWPSFASRFGRRLNQRLLCRQLLPVLRELSEPPIVVTTIPLVADLVGKLPVRRWIYYCVDDFGVWPGLDGTTLRTMEMELVRGVDILVAASAVLQQQLAAAGRDALLLTHGVDLPYWSQPTGPVPPAVAQLKTPLIVFWGLIDRRLDLAVLHALAEAVPEATLVLAGPEDDPDPGLAQVPRLVRPGSLPFEQLPALAAAAAVLIMPYADLPVTRAMEPLKLKEYLATGRPVVVRDLPANRAWADALDLADSPAAFALAVRSRLAGKLPAGQNLARARLAQESWADKAALFTTYALNTDPPASAETPA